MEYDIAIIGGGPAGMMAAISAAQNGAKVVLLEKNKKLGIKLLITGHGRCNLTNQAADNKTFIEALGKNGKFLYSALNRFNFTDTINFFTKQGLALKTELNNKVYPKSDKSQDVLEVLITLLKKNKVNIVFDSTVKKIITNKGIIKNLQLATGNKIKAKNYILCSGGKSYPLTGSDGSGYLLAKQVGHSITPLAPGLTPIIINEPDIDSVEGVSLQNVLLKVNSSSKKIASTQGDVMITNTGFSGPAPINLSQKIATEIESQLTLTLDLMPDLNNEILEKTLFNLFLNNPNKNLQQILGSLLPQRFVRYIGERNNLDLNHKCHETTSAERWRLVEILKKQIYTIKGLDGFDKAMVTVGGINLKEVDTKTMRSKLIENLYFAGEILDLSGPTGGYNLQICWTTGYIAGQEAAK